MFRPTRRYRLDSTLLALGLMVLLLSACDMPSDGGSVGRDKVPRAKPTGRRVSGKETRGVETTGVTASDSEAAPRPASEEIAGGSSLANWPVFRGTASATGVAESTLPATPQLLWKFSVEKETGQKSGFESTAAIVDGVVYVGDDSAHFFAIDLASGKLLWKIENEAGFTASAAVHDGRVFIGDNDGVFYCLDAKDGRVLWKHVTENQINSSATFFEESVIVGSQDGTLHRFAQDDGRIAWKYLVPVDGGIQCSPAISEGRTFVAGCDARFHTIDLLDGESKAVIEIGGPALSTPALSGEIAYCGTNSGELLSIDWKNAKILWRYSPRRRTEYRSSPAVTDKLVILGGRNKLVEAIDRKTGNVAWSFTTRGRVDGSPVVVGSRVFIGSGDGRLYAIDLDDGQSSWQFDAGGRFFASPAVARGRLVIGNTDGVLYCFGSQENAR